MPNIFKVVSKLPVPKRWKLEWYRSLLHRVYAKDIKQARKEKDGDKVDSLQMGLRFEMEMHEEDEDNYYTRILLRKARQLRVPIPHQKEESGEESEFWYQGRNTGGWYLTNIGIGLSASFQLGQHLVEKVDYFTWFPQHIVVAGVNRISLYWYF